MKNSFFNLNRRVFSTKLSSIFKYSDPSNPKVFLKIAKGDSEIGQLVFELYKNKCPKTVDNFLKICSGDNINKICYKSSSFNKIISGFMAQGGRLKNNSPSELETCFPDENLNLKHHKRGLLTMDNDGSDTNYSRFMVTFDETPWLDGYHVVFGELVEGENVLKEIENNASYDGKPKANIKITDCGNLI